MATSPEKWEAIKALFEAAQEIPQSKIPAFLAQSSLDSEVRAEVQRLLDEYEQAGSFLSVPAANTPGFDDLLDPKYHRDEVIGDTFRIIDFVAEGGMGIVYKAE